MSMTAAHDAHTAASAGPWPTPLQAARNLQSINKAIRAIKRSNSSKSNEDAVARANGRVDAAMELPISTMAEAEAKLRLLLLSEREDLHEIQLVALQSIAAVLAAAVKASAN